MLIKDQSEYKNGRVQKMIKQNRIKWLSRLVCMQQWPLCENCEVLCNSTKLSNTEVKQKLYTYD
jgi:hypothetical protein